MSDKLPAACGRHTLIVPFVAALTAAAALAAPSPARAQQAGAEAGLEEITVTARRREESLQDVPIAVSAYSADQLASIGAPDITTLQQSTPNLTLQVARGTNSTLIAFIRGVGQQDPLWGFEPGVGLYVDDVYVARPQGAVLDIYDIQRIEVLRGPQGTLYGRNTIGGAVKYVTRRLGHDPKFDAKLNFGSYGQHDYLLTGAVPLSDSLSVGGGVAIYRRDGYGRNLVTGAQHYDKDVDGFRLSAEWTPSESVFVRLAGDYTDDKSNPKHGHREQAGAGLAAGETVLPKVYDTRGGVGDSNDVRNKGVSLLAQWDVSDQLTLKSITAYREGDTNTVIDFDTGPAVALDVPAYYDDNQTTEELQLIYTGPRVQAVAGLYYLDAWATGAFDTILGIANLTIATQGSVKTKSVAGYADVSYTINDQWSVSVGGRYTKDDKDGQVYRQNFTGLRSPLFGNRTAIAGLLRTRYANSRSFSEFTPRLSVTWQPSDAATLYASYGRGFKSGGFDMRGDAFAFPGTADGYDPEYVNTYELGAKGTFADGRVRLAAAVFRSDYKDQQITSQFALPTTPPTIVSFVDNAAGSTINGAELEGTIAFNEAVALNLSAGWIDAKFDEFVTYDATTGTRRNLADQRSFQNTPELMGSASLTLRHAFAGGELSFVPSVSYRSKYQMFEAPLPLLDQKAYTLVDASLNWTLDGGRFGVSLHGRNLTDEHYKVGGYSFPGATFGNVQSSFYGPPRTYTFSVAYRFE
ncbi:MAG: TonB-dependent receptor [Steroidobacteraceae bacterium]